MPPSFPTKGLYAITPDISDTQLLLDKVKKVLVGGVALIQYRDKISNASEKIFRAKAIHRLCLQHSVPLIINDDPELALVCKAEGVHLGQTDGSIQHAHSIDPVKPILIVEICRSLNKTSACSSKSVALSGMSRCTVLESCTVRQVIIEQG